MFATVCLRKKTKREERREREREREREIQREEQKYLRTSTYKNTPFDKYKLEREIEMIDRERERGQE
jgi:hypothetical protein